MKNLLQVIEEEPESEVNILYRKLSENYDNGEKREFLRWLLYGDHKLRGETEKYE